MNGNRRKRLPVAPGARTDRAPSTAGRQGCHTASSYSSGMGRQLVLLEETSPWRLDEASKERGRRGLAAARAALAQAVRKAAA